jgi:prepilin-type N-terminal cleavage/methylation domain-containing protein
MKTQNSSPLRRTPAFTLIELLVVMAVIAILAGLLFPVAGIIKKNATIKRVQTALRSVENAIETYKENLKVYPPQNPNNPALNVLYYELVGTKLVGTEYQTESGQGGIATGNLTAFFGPGVEGFVNVSRGGGDEVQASKNCFVGILPANHLEVGGAITATLLGITDIGPLMYTNTASQRIINPWRYSSSSATNNSGSYDLWVDVIIGGKTNRFSNWNDKPVLVNY